MYRFIKSGGHLPFGILGVPSCITCQPVAPQTTWQSLILNAATMKLRARQRCGDALPATQWGNKLHRASGSVCSWSIAPPVAPNEWWLRNWLITKFVCVLYPDQAWDGTGELPHWHVIVEGKCGGGEHMTIFRHRKEQPGGTPEGTYIEDMRFADYPPAGLPPLQITVTGSTSI